MRDVNKTLPFNKFKPETKLSYSYRKDCTGLALAALMVL